MSSTIRFTKMHGLGNDFVVIDATNQQINLTNEQIRFIADRHFGIGCDQVLLIEAADSPDVDFIYRIFNADGSEVGQCGNGARCFARYVYDKGLTQKRDIRVKTASGLIIPNIEEDDQVTVNMGTPRFVPADIPIASTQQQTLYDIAINNTNVQFGAVSIGNPHAVITVDNIDEAPVEQLGPILENHAFFPERANIGFMQVMNRQHLRLRVFERGAGETLACGTGACAAMVVARQQNLIDNEATVTLPGGDLSIRWQGDDTPVMMTGPANYVYEGKITL